MVRAVEWLRAEGAKFIRVGNIVWQQWVLAPPRPITPGLDWKGRGPDVTLRTLAANLERRGGTLLRGTPQVLSQLCMVPIWACCVSATSSVTCVISS